MPVAIADLVDPASTAVITMEVQRGVCGDLASMPTLSDAVAAEGLLPRIGALLGAARTAGVPVVHCTFSMVPDRALCPLNTPVLRRLAKNPEHMLAGTPLVEVCPELGPEPGDLFSDRHHGMSPFIGTELDGMLRARNVRTVVVTGVSANLGVFGSAIEAVNFGYEVVIPRDGTVGVPVEFGNDVLNNSLAVVATLTTVDALIGAWS